MTCTVSPSHRRGELAGLVVVDEQPHVRADAIVFVDHAEADPGTALLERAQHLGERLAAQGQRGGAGGVGPERTRDAYGAAHEHQAA